MIASKKRREEKRAEAHERKTRAEALASQQRPDLRERFKSVPFPEPYGREFQTPIEDTLMDTYNQANASLKYDESLGEGGYSVDDPLSAENTSAPRGVPAGRP